MKSKLEELFREKLDDAGFEHKCIKSAKPAHILNGAGRSCILLFEPEPEVALC